MHSRIWISYEIKYWYITIPDGLRATDSFDYVTLYDRFKVPKAKIEVRVPEGKKPGDQVKMAELRIQDKHGTRSLDASAFGKQGPFETILGFKGRFVDDTIEV